MSEKTSVWLSKQGNWKEGGPERGQTQPASMCQGDTGRTKEQVAWRNELARSPPVRGELQRDTHVVCCPGPLTTSIPMSIN